MSDLLDQISLIEQSCAVKRTPCGAGEMVFRSWRSSDLSFNEIPNEALKDLPEDSEGFVSREIVVMLHGGSGSWSHWIKNIPYLANDYELIVPDLPGLGDSASLPSNCDPADVAKVVSQGLKEILGTKRFHLIAFSWGCVVASGVAVEFHSQVKSLLLVGPASTGTLPEKRTMKPLVRRSRSMNAIEITEVNKENLARLMIHDREKIDSMAIETHNRNTRLARFNSPKYADGEHLTQFLAATQVNLLVIYGELDAVTYPNLAERKARILNARPDVHFDVLGLTGHWLQYEQADWFNHRAASWLEANISA